MDKLVRSKVFSKLIEELIELSISRGVYWESEGKMVDTRLCGWVGSKLMVQSNYKQMRIKWTLPSGSAGTPERARPGPNTPTPTCRTGSMSSTRAM